MMAIFKSNLMLVYITAYGAKFVYTRHTEMCVNRCKKACSFWSITYIFKIDITKYCISLLTAVIYALWTSLIYSLNYSLQYFRLYIQIWVTIAHLIYIKNWIFKLRKKYRDQIKGAVESTVVITTYKR